MRFVKGFTRIFRVQFCSFIELTSQKFVSDSSIDMKQKSPCTAEFKANGGFSGSPLPNDYFVNDGWLAAKGSFHQREIRGQKFCRRGWRPPVSLTVAVRSNRLPGKFTPMISNHPFARIRGHSHRHHFAIVRIYYREMRFIEGFSGILAMQSCDVMTQGSRKIMSDSSIDMKQKSQNTAETRQVVRLEKLKHSASRVAAHKNLMDTGIVFDGWPLRNCSFFPVASIGHKGRKSPKAFSVCGTPLPVCFRAEFQCGGRINERNGKDTLFQNGTKPFENQLKSVLCLVP